MELYLLRHGIAEERDSVKYRDDSKRPLTPEGVKKMRQITKGAKNFGVEFDLILSSPYMRAKQTADIFAKGFKALETLRFTRNLEPTVSHSHLISELNQKYTAKCHAIVLVGHEPFLSGLMSRLLIGTQELQLDFKKGGLAKLSLESLTQKQCARLSWLLTPKQLRQMA